MSNFANVPIENCCDVLDSKRIPVNEEERYLRKGTTPYYGANGLQGYIDGYIFDEPLILIAEDGGYFDEYQTRPIAYRISGKSWVNNHAHILKAKSDYDQNYIFYSLEHKDITPFIKGGTRAKLNQAELKNIRICTPPLPHQRKIARILTTVDNIIEKTEAAIAKYKAIKQGMMHDLFTRGIDVKTGKLRPKFEDAPELYKESELGWIPKEWEVDELGTLVETYAGGTPSRSRPEYFGGDIPWVSSSEVNQPEICKTKENITREGFENSSVKWVKEGSILIAMYGATAGKISKLRINATTNQAVLACIDSKDLKSGFIFHLANFLMDKILFKVQGSGQPNLSKDIIDTTPIFKISIAEQILITDRLNTIDRLIANEKKSVDKLKQQKTGLMQDLLTGKKEVTPDPEDYKEMEI